MLAERERVPSGVPQRLLIFSAFVFLLVLLSYFGLAFGYNPFLQKAIGEGNAKLDELGRRISADDQRELTKLYSQISNIGKLLSSHVLGSRVLTFLETTTVPQVTYFGADLSAPDRRLTLDGAAASYDELVRQLKAYGGAREVERMSLESSEAVGSVVRFKVSLVMQPEVFQP